jgi:hypothetical protein
MMIALKVSVFMNKTRSFEFSSENNFLKTRKRQLKHLQKYNKRLFNGARKGPIRN